LIEIYICGPTADPPNRIKILLFNVAGDADDLKLNGFIPPAGILSAGPAGFLSENYCFAIFSSMTIMGTETAYRSPQRIALAATECSLPSGKPGVTM